MLQQQIYAGRRITIQRCALLREQVAAAVITTLGHEPGSALDGVALPATQCLETMLVEMLVAAIRIVVTVRGMRCPECRVQAPPRAPCGPANS